MTKAQHNGISTSSTKKLSCGSKRRGKSMPITGANPWELGFVKVIRGIRITKLKIE